MIFVFGSNLAGIHGAGAALTAYQLHGAVIGIYEGMQGNAYAIPTKDAQIRYPLPLTEVEQHVETFLQFAVSNPNQGFQITRIGCGLAGFTDVQIAPMFRRATPNCFFDFKWRPLLPSGFEYWGTF